MKKILNKRLETISAFINDNDKVMDIGCDHALLGIYLVLNRINIKVISSDINHGPLEKAEENILKYGVEGKIDLRLGDGLEVIDDDINIVIISGMGGINIVNILEKINNYPQVSRLILSPNNDFPLVRKQISKLGFKIKKEMMISENNKYYPIIEFIKGKEEINDFFGKLDLSDEIVKNYYQNLYNKNKEILKNVYNIDLIKENKLIEDKMKS